jgi:ABC-2 type transport system permease protein
VGQIGGVFVKGMKEFFREGAVLFWSIGWPIIWLLMSVFLFLSEVPEEEEALAKGGVTISMCTFSLMTVGMDMLPGAIAQDRERGLFRKLKSMPIKPWKEFLGRSASLLAFSAVGILIIMAVGLALGAEFSFTTEELLKSLGFFLLILIASAGIGLLIGTFIKSVQLAIGLGIVVMLVTASISGIFMPFEGLPNALQQFSKVFPVSASNSAILYLLAEGQGLGGYDPLGQVYLDIILSIALFAVGLIAYSKICWGKE